MCTMNTMNWVYHFPNMSFLLLEIMGFIQLVQLRFGQLVLHLDLHLGPNPVVDMWLGRDLHIVCLVY